MNTVDASVATLFDEVGAALKAARRFLTDQLSPLRPGWAPEPEGDMDPWPTAQILYFLPNLENVGAILAGLGWLVERQNSDGSWTSTNYGKLPDTSSTACCTIALLHHIGPTSIAAQRGIQWLCEQYSDGWANMPDQSKSEHVHYYDTAYALRALARAPRQSVGGLPIPEGKRLSSLRVQQAKTLLLKARVPGPGWGFQPKEPPDPSFTSYVLHALMDVQRLWNIKLPREQLVEAVNWLMTQQNVDGTWTDWQGTSTSPEATGYAVYVLLTAGLPAAHPCILKAVSWILANQLEKGGWGLYGRDDDSPINWLTNVVASSLTAFQMAAREQETDAANTLAFEPKEFKPRNLDHAHAEGALFAMETRLVEQIPFSSTGASVDLNQLYDSPLKMSLKDVPYTRELDHTMYKALDKYVSQKLPDEEIETCLRSGDRIEIHGIYPDHLREVADKLQLTNIEEVSFQHKKPVTSFNVKRPGFFRASRKSNQRILIVAVIPGRDYLMHYSSLVRHLVMQRYTTHAAQRISVFHYPLAERRLASWTKLDATLVQPKDRVLLGYVAEVRARIGSDTRFQLTGCQENDYYASFRYALQDGSILNMLGVKYCFWGSISEVLTNAICVLGASEILYVAKLGSLTSPGDLYERIYCPSQYYVLSHDQIRHESGPIDNRVLQRFPGLDSGVHVSVPTVLEEDYKQRKVATDLKGRSIDNEIAQMARAIAFFNRSRDDKCNVAFSAIHFATDYVRSQEDQAVATHHDLSKMRDPEAVSKKKGILDRICNEVLVPYLSGDTAALATVPAQPIAASASVQRSQLLQSGMVRIGVIGGGKHASENLIPALHLLSSTKITAVSSREPDRLAQLGRQYQVPYTTTDWTQLVNRDRVDAIVVSATPYVHESVLQFALERGVHVFVEKPPASDAAALKSLTNLADGFPEVVTFVDYNFRFALGYQKLLEVVAESGPIEYIKIHYLTNKPREPILGFVSVLRSFLYAVGIHAIELCVRLLGNVGTVSSAVRRLGQERFAITTVLTGVDGRQAAIDLGNYSNRFESRMELVTSSGVVGVLDDLRCVRWYGAPDKKMEPHDRKEVTEYVLPALRGGFGIGGYEGALAAFRDAILAGKPSDSPLSASVAVYRVIQAILEEAKD